MNVRILTFILLAFLAVCLHADITVNARFDPVRTNVGSTAKYVVEITETDVAKLPQIERITSLPIPEINGLMLRGGRTSTSQQTNIINGQAEYSVTQQLIIDAVASEVGSYTIPGYTLQYKGATVQVPGATLTAIERSANAAPTANELVFLNVDTPEELYVGQTTPVTLKLYVLGNVQLRGISAFERDADGFTISGGPTEGEATESMESINGRRYRTYSWPMMITPIIVGEQPANFQFTVNVRLPSQRNTRNSPLGNSIFDDFFGRAEQINVNTKDSRVNVRPLPTKGQPESFSGAIGQFNIKVSSDNKSTRLNEPIMLSLKIRGKGNFNRIQAPKLNNVEDWRSYSPESTFTADSANELKGTKRFDYVFVPEKAGTLELPEVSFSFFDPAVKEYVELSSPAIAVEVVPSNIPLAGIPASTDSKNGTDEEPPANLTRTLEPEEVLSTLDYQPKKGRTVSANGSITPFFYWLNSSLLVIASTAAILIYQRQRLLKSPHYELVHNTRQELKIALNKTTSEDTATFFSNAQKAIRLAATIQTKSSLQTAHLATLETHLKKSGMDDATIDQIRNLFETAEKHQFSGHQREVSLDEHRKQLKTLLKVITD